MKVNLIFLQKAKDEPEQVIDEFENLEDIHSRTRSRNKTPLQPEGRAGLRVRLAEAARAGLPRQTNDQSHSSTPLRHAYIRDASNVNANRLITRAVQAGIWL